MMNQGLMGARPPRFYDYCIGGQLILWASRHWMRAYRRGRTVPPCVWQSFSVSGLAEVYAELCGLLTIIAFREFPARGFGRPDSARLTDSEIGFLTVLDTVENSGDQRAVVMMDGVATPAVARAIVAKCHRILNLLHAEGHRIAHCRPADRMDRANERTDAALEATVH